MLTGQSVIDANSQVFMFESAMLSTISLYLMNLR